MLFILQYYYCVNYSWYICCIRDSLSVNFFIIYCVVVVVIDEDGFFFVIFDICNISIDIGYIGVVFGQ